MMRRWFLSFMAVILFTTAFSFSTAVAAEQRMVIKEDTVLRKVPGGSVEEGIPIQAGTVVNVNQTPQLSNDEIYLLVVDPNSRFGYVKESELKEEEGVAQDEGSGQEEMVQEDTLRGVLKWIVPQKAVAFENHIYEVIEIYAHASDANMMCITRGGHLATISSQAEQTAIERLLQESGARNAYWIGLSTTFDGTWRWMTGEEMTYTNWNPGEPKVEIEATKYGIIYNTDDAGAGIQKYKWGINNTVGLIEQNSITDKIQSVYHYGIICEYECDEDMAALFQRNKQNLSNEKQIKESVAFLDAIPSAVVGETVAIRHELTEKSGIPVISLMEIQNTSIIMYKGDQLVTRWDNVLEEETHPYTFTEAGNYDIHFVIVTKEGTGITTDTIRVAVEEPKGPLVLSGIEVAQENDSDAFWEINYYGGYGDKEMEVYFVNAETGAVADQIGPAYYPCGHYRPQTGGTYYISAKITCKGDELWAESVPFYVPGRN